MEQKTSWDDIPTLSLDDDAESMLTEEEKKQQRTTIRLDCNALLKMAMEDTQKITIQIATRKGVLPNKGTLQDLSQTGMRFSLPDHGLHINDVIQFLTRIGNRPIKAKAIVRWTNNDLLGIEFVNPNPEDVHFLSQLHAAIRLNRV